MEGAMVRRGQGILKRDAGMAATVSVLREAPLVPYLTSHPSSIPVVVLPCDLRPSTVTLLSGYSLPPPPCFVKSLESSR